MKPSFGIIGPKAEQKIKLIFKSNQSGALSERDGLQLVIQVNISESNYNITAKSREINKKF